MARLVTDQPGALTVWQRPYSGRGSAPGSFRNTYSTVPISPSDRLGVTDTQARQDRYHTIDRKKALWDGHGGAG